MNLIDTCAKHGVHFVNRSYGKATTGSITLDALEKIVKDATPQLNVVTTGTGYFKAGLPARIVGGGSRDVFVGPVGHEVKMTVPEFTLELIDANGIPYTREFCQYGRDFVF